MQKRHRRRAAAGLLPAAQEELRRLRAEWAALRDTDLVEVTLTECIDETSNMRDRREAERATGEALRGVVALVEVGSEIRALPLRAGLAALGATVQPAWSPLVTHLIWNEGGDRVARANARASAAHVVSPLWVESCACAARRLPERSFPATTRPSDLPEPSTLLKLLKKADRDNVPFPDFTSTAGVNRSVTKRRPVATVTSRDVGLVDETDESKDRSAGTSRDTSAATTSRDISTDTSAWSRRRSDSSEDSAIPDEETRVNKRPRRALPKSVSSPGEGLPASHAARHQATVSAASVSRAATQRDMTALARAERSARKHAAGPSDTNRAGHRSRPLPRRDRAGVAPEAAPAARPQPPRARPAAATHLTPSQDTIHSRDGKIRVVLTGMSSTDRHNIFVEIKKLSAKVQRKVNYKTTHVVVGQYYSTGGAVGPRSQRTVSALAGAARGCRVVSAQWVYDSVQAGQWLSYRQYAVEQFRNLAEKAYLERRYFDLMSSEYAYNVFQGRRVRVHSSTPVRERVAARHLLALCGAVVQDRATRDQGLAAPDLGLSLAAQTVDTRYGPDDGTRDCSRGERLAWSRVRDPASSSPLVLGTRPGDVAARWVFDSVVSAHMRSVRKYKCAGAHTPPVE